MYRKCIVINLVWNNKVCFPFCYRSGNNFHRQTRLAYNLMFVLVPSLSSREFVFSIYSQSMDGRCVKIFLCVSVGVYMSVDCCRKWLNSSIVYHIFATSQWKVQASYARYENIHAFVHLYVHAGSKFDTVQIDTCTYVCMYAYIHKILICRFSSLHHHITI